MDQASSCGHREVLAHVHELCASLDPALVAPGDVGRLFDSLTAMRRLVDGAITRLAPRYRLSGAWQDRGAKTAEDGIAKATGESPAGAKRRLQAARELERQPRLDDALRTGAVSTEQAQVIATAAGDVAGEEKLIDVARSGSHVELRREAARERARHDHDDEQRRCRQQRLRRLSRWTDEDGMYNLLLKTLPELGAEIDARLKPLVDNEFQTARRDGRREPVDAYAADALVGMLTGTGERCGRSSGQAVRPERKVIALVDIHALNRGHTVGDEVCELAGVGPVSVTAVRALFGDAAMTAVFRDAEDIRSVVHLGRQVTATQRTALEARGPVCGVEGCGSTRQLEIDHTIGWAYTLETRVDHLEWLCSRDHHLKTTRNLLAIGPPGQRTLVERDPDDPTRPKTPLVRVRPAPVLDATGADPPNFGSSGSRSPGPTRREPRQATLQFQT